jgi:predicted hydrocarbon binding protein
MAKASQELDTLKEKLVSWEKALKSSSDPTAEKIGKEIAMLTQKWPGTFPGTLAPFFKEMDGFVYYNSEFLSASENLGKKFSEVGRVLGALGNWYRSH